jgi:hypothetical protein
MRSINHRKHPARPYRNDFDFAPFGDVSALVLITRNAARFDGEFSATGQIAPAETILSSRAVVTARQGYMYDQQDFVTAPNAAANDDTKDTAMEPRFMYRNTLFDSVMDFLDRYDRMAGRQQSGKYAR